MRHKEEILRLGAEGFTYSQIQDKLGCSKGTIAYHLGTGQKDKNKQRQKNKRKLITEYLAEYKEKRGCADCKTKYPSYVLDFDHQGDKSFGIANWSKVTASFEKIIEEIEKCDVVCANCHRIRTHKPS